MNSIIIVCIATLCGCVMGICAGKILKKNIYKNILNSAEIQDDSGSSYEIFNNAGVTREFRQFEIKSAEVFSKKFVLKLAEKIKNIASKQIVDVLNKNENSIKKRISKEIEKYFEESIREFLCRVRKEEKTVYEVLSDERLCFCDVSISDMIVKIRKNLSEKIYLEIKNAQIEKILAIKVRDGIRDKIKRKLLMSIVVNEGLLNEFETGVEKSIGYYLESQFKCDLSTKMDDKLDEILKLKIKDYFTKFVKYYLQLLESKYEGRQNLKIENLEILSKDSEDIFEKPETEISRILYDRFVREKIERILDEIYGNSKKWTNYLIDYVLREDNVQLLVNAVKTNMKRVEFFLVATGTAIGLVSSVVSNILFFL